MNLQVQHGYKSALIKVLTTQFTKQGKYQKKTGYEESVRKRGKKILKMASNSSLEFHQSELLRLVENQYL